MKMPPGSGIRADGDDLLIDTAAILPPPQTEGRLAASRDRRPAVGDADERLGVPSAAAADVAVAAARNYLYFYRRQHPVRKAHDERRRHAAHRRKPAGSVRFLSRAKYEAQLVAGYSRNTPRKGLQVFMPDYARTVASGGDWRHRGCDEGSPPLDARLIRAYARADDADAERRAGLARWQRRPAPPRRRRRSRSSSRMLSFQPSNG